MADVFSKSKRSEVMSRIRSRGNKATELALLKLFRRHGINGWRRHMAIGGRAVLRSAAVPAAGSSTVPVRGSPRRRDAASTRRRGRPRHGVRTFSVRPDFIFPKLRLAVFVDGCFWHGCPRHATQPKGNRGFWKNKFAKNKARDRRVNRALRKQGWKVVRIWECSLKKNPLNCIARIQRVSGLRF